MSEDFGAPIPPMEEPKSRNTIVIIIAILVLVMLCCCIAIVAGGWYLWTYGDTIFGFTLQALQLLA